MTTYLVHYTYRGLPREERYSSLTDAMVVAENARCSGPDVVLQGITVEFDQAV